MRWWDREARCVCVCGEGRYAIIQDRNNGLT